MLQGIEAVNYIETLTDILCRIILLSMKTLSERLAFAMKETGNQNQTALAKKSGVSQSTISKILRGENATSKDSPKLAVAMGVSSDWLIGGQGNIWGDGSGRIEGVDISRQLSLWDAEGDTGNTINWISEVPDHYQAYVMTGNTGISKAPRGAIVVVDPHQIPLTGDLVVAVIAGVVSVFAYHFNGAGESFLSVDDERVPLAKITDQSILRGPAQQIYIPTLSR